MPRSVNLDAVATKRRGPCRFARVLIVCLAAGALSTPALAAEPPAASRVAYESHRRGEHALAIRQARSAAEAHPQNAGAWRVLGWILNQQGRTREAVDAYLRAVALDRTDSVAWNNLGVAYLEIGDAQEALHALEKALELEPRYADALNNRGVALERLSRQREAIRAYEEAAQADPEHAIALNNLGAQRMAVGDRRGARRAIQRATRLAPEFVAARLNLLLLDEGPSGGAEVLERLEAEARRPGAALAIRHRALLARATHEREAGRLAEAREHYLQALDLMPRDAKVLNNLAVVEDELGMDRQALMHLGMALDAAPDSPIAQNNIGIVHVHRGDFDQAERVFRELVAHDPRFHRGWYNLGVVLGGRGDIVEAREAIRKAVALAPNDADARYNLGLLNREVGAPIRDERRSYEEALRLDDQLAEAHLALGALLADPTTPRALRDERRARHHLERFLRLARPDDVSGIEQARLWLAWLETPRS